MKLGRNSGAVTKTVTERSLMKDKKWNSWALIKLIVVISLQMLEGVLNAKKNQIIYFLFYSRPNMKAFHKVAAVGLCVCACAHVCVSMYVCIRHS